MGSISPGGVFTFETRYMACTNQAIGGYLPINPFCGSFSGALVSLLFRNDRSTQLTYQLLAPILGPARTASPAAAGTANPAPLSHQHRTEPYSPLHPDHARLYALPSARPPPTPIFCLHASLDTAGRREIQLLRPEPAPGSLRRRLPLKCKMGSQCAGSTVKTALAALPNQCMEILSVVSNAGQNRMPVVGPFSPEHPPSQRDRYDANSEYSQR